MKPTRHHPFCPDPRDHPTADCPDPIAAPVDRDGLREALEHIADWANDCADDDMFYGFADIRDIAREALAAAPVGRDGLRDVFDRLEATFDLMTPDSWDEPDVRHRIAQGVWFAMADIKRLQGDHSWPALSAPEPKDRPPCVADESSCFDEDCPKHGFDREDSR